MKISIGGPGKLTSGIDLVDSYDYSWSCDFSKGGYNNEGYSIAGLDIASPTGQWDVPLLVPTGIQFIGENMGAMLPGWKDNNAFVGPWHSHHGIAPLSNPLPASALRSGYKYITFVITPISLNILPSVLFGPYLANEADEGFYGASWDTLSHVNGKVISTAHGEFVDGETDRDLISGSRLSEWNSGKLTSFTWDMTRGAGTILDQDINWIYFFIHDGGVAPHVIDINFILHGIIVSSKPPNVRTLPIRTTPGGESR